MIKFICTSGNAYEITRETHSTHRSKYEAATWYIKPSCENEADRKELEERRVVANLAGFSGEKSWNSKFTAIYQKVYFS
jgi:hypothetical protein